jgi:hypothetical protein
MPTLETLVTNVTGLMENFWTRDLLATGFVGPVLGIRLVGLNQFVPVRVVCSP